MNSILDKIFEYGFHETEINSISIERNEVTIVFDSGVYYLDNSGKEIDLTDAIKLIITIGSSTEPVENCFEIKEYGKKTSYVDFKNFQNEIKKNHILFQ